MFERKSCSIFEIEDVDYDFDFYEKKEIVSKMLKNQNPKPVERFDSTGTKWDLWGNIDDYFYLYIESVKIETNTCVSNFIEDFLSFLPQLAYTDNKTLICPFEDEGSAFAFITVPMGNNFIRVSVFDSGMVWEYCADKKFKADIVINKDTFLKQMQEILQQAANVDEEPRNVTYDWVNKIKYTIKELNKYFESPENFKKNYEPKRHIRVFDVAHKTLENKWEFEVFLEGDDKANEMYWKKLKSEGKILDYDFFEQYSEDLFVWKRELNDLIKLSEDEIRKDLETDMGDRIDRNWVYSETTKQWYSENEIMPSPKEKILGIIYSRLNYEVSLDTEPYPHTEDGLLESYIDASYDIHGNLSEDNPGSLQCLLTLKDDSLTACKIEFDYRYNKQIRNALKKAQNGEYVRFDICENNPQKMHLWQQFYKNSTSEDAKYITMACYDINGKELDVITADKKEFIKCFTNALDEIQHKIDVIKHTMDIGQQLDIKNKFKLFDSKYYDNFENTDNFINGYSCVYQNSIYGWGIINKNLEWVIKPEYSNIHYTNDKGQKCCKSIIKYYYLHNIDGNLFIAQKQDGKQFVMDINENIKFPFMADKIYYGFNNQGLYFIFADEDKTVITDSKGKDLFSLNFEVGEKFWLFDEIIVFSKNCKFGIVDWNGNIIIDFIFSDIKPDKNNLDFIPVKYIDIWGFINKKGEIIDIKLD